MTADIHPESTGDSTLQDATVSILEESEVLVLDSKDRDMLFDALPNPPSPNDALRKAPEEYRRTMEA